MRFVYRTLIRATPERLWEALTERELLRRYWLNRDVEVGHRVGEPFGIDWKGQPTDRGEVLVYDPPRTLSYSFDNLILGESGTRVTFSLEPQGEAVLLTVVHDGLGAESRLLPSVAGGWPLILSALKSLLEGVELDYSQVEVGDGPLDSPLQTVYRTLIAASPERVWEALTADTEGYFFGRRVESDWRVGSSVRYFRSDGSLDVSGEVLRVDPPRLLDYTWRVEGFEHPRCWVTFELVAFGSATRLTLIEHHAEPLDEATLEGGRKGWPRILSGLKSLVETGRTL